MKKEILIICFLSAISLTYSFGQSEVITGENSTFESSRGEIPVINIFNKKDENNPNVLQPTKKGGKSRGGECLAFFDNYTGYFLLGYINDELKLFVDGWGEAATWVKTGNTELKAMAYYEDGSGITWEPPKLSCENFEILNFEILFNGYKLYYDN